MTTISDLDGEFMHETKLQLEMKHKRTQRANEGYCLSYRVKYCIVEEPKLQSQIPK